MNKLNLWYFKLACGDEIISETAPTTETDFYTLKNPLLLKDVHDESSGATAIILQDYVPYTDSKTSIRLSKTQIISHAIVDGSMVDYYLASLEFNTLFGSKDNDVKILKAAAHLRKYTAEQLAKDTKAPSSLIMAEEDLWDELDEDYFGLNASANTTIH